jgi:hypothetical protein
MAGDQEMDGGKEAEELFDEEVAAMLRELGLTRKAPRAYVKTDWTVEELYAAALPDPRWIVP